MAIKRERVTNFYSGHVQGVGFRYTVKSLTVSFEVTGQVRNLPDGAQVQVELLTSEGGRLAVSAGSSRFELACLPREDFPQMAAGALPHKFRLAADDLKRIIAKTRFAISTEETRYYLNGIYLHAAKDAKPPVMRAVATDGHRLARIEIPAPQGAAGMPGVIVPRKAVAEVQKLIEGLDTDVTIEISPTKARFSFADVVLGTSILGYTVWGQMVNATSFLAPLGMSYALLNRRLLDLGFALNRAAVYTGVSIVGAWAITWSPAIFVMRAITSSEL